MQDNLEEVGPNFLLAPSVDQNKIPMSLALAHLIQMPIAGSCFPI
jgi:hypothetical protein